MDDERQPLLTDVPMCIKFYCSQRYNYIRYIVACSSISSTQACTFQLCVSVHQYTVHSTFIVEPKHLKVVFGLIFIERVSAYALFYFLPCAMESLSATDHYALTVICVSFWSEHIL